MTLLALIRHGATEWNCAGRMQGRHDAPLSADGRAAVAALALPAELAGFTWHSSPLRRARETAALLGITDARPEPRLIEMDWGRWEGRTLAELRGMAATEGETFASREAAGLDFRPPDGESPRDVQVRLAPFLAAVARAGRPSGAISHKGVIRAVFARAIGWDLRGKPPIRLAWNAAHLFSLAADGTPAPFLLNLTLPPRHEAASR
jgi:broad specificity phosphatase PhoE